jgi:hypothetical protein
MFCKLFFQLTDFRVMCSLVNGRNNVRSHGRSFRMNCTQNTTYQLFVCKLKVLWRTSIFPLYWTHRRNTTSGFWYTISFNGPLGLRIKCKRVALRSEDVVNPYSPIQTIINSGYDKEKERNRLRVQGNFMRTFWIARIYALGKADTYMVCI